MRHTYFSDKVGDELSPWDLLFHQVEMLDHAAKLAVESKNIEALMAVAEMTLDSSDRLTAIVLGIGAEEEAELNGFKQKQPVGFDTTRIVSTEEPSEIEGDCEEDC